MNDRSVAQAVLDWLKPKLAGVSVKYEDLPAGVEGAMLKTSPGEPYVKRYKSGGYVAAYDFQVYLRQLNEDTADRLGALEVLGAVCDSIGAGDMPAEPDGIVWQDFNVKTMPARFTTRDDGTTDYQMTARLTYYKKG